MTFKRLNISKLSIIGFCTLLTSISSLTACNSTQAQEQSTQQAQEQSSAQAQEQSPLKQRRRGRRNPTAGANLENMTLESISFRGQTRDYYIHTPSSYQSNKSTPLVLAFHGGVGRGDTMAQKTGLNAVADREGFIVVYPNGIDRGDRGGRWNDGRIASQQGAGSDDVAFVRALIDHLVRTKNIDSRRIYSTGGSNGGFFTQRLACELSDKISAFASVSATLPQSLQSRCNPPRSISMLMINGTADPLVPWQGGQVQIGAGGNILSAPATVEFWRKHNNCSTNPNVEQLPDTQNDGTKVKKATYSGCRNNTPLVFYTVEGGGHGWPGSRSERRSEARSGKVSREILASYVIWNFFEPQTLR